jgi:hypothetical protein
MRKECDLLIGQHATSLSCERRHEFTRNPVRDDLAETVFSDYSEINWIGKRERRSAFAVLSVACSTVLFIECGEGKDFVRTLNLRPRSRTARDVIATSGGKAGHGKKHRAVRRGFESGRSHFNSSLVSV